MKKTIAILLAALTLLALCACGKEKAPADTPVTGGWSQVDGAVLSDKARSAFDKAMEELVGVDYDPLALLATQVVAGTNYCLLCEATVVYPDAKPYYALVYVYEDLQGSKIVRLNIGNISESGKIEDAGSPEEALAGGWQVDRESTVEAKDVLLHLAKQTVAGTNHCVLCKGNELVFLYENLEGKVEETQRVAIDIGALWQ